MQAFYLSRNQHGYFRVRLHAPVYGTLGQAKITHTQNRQQAPLSADEWCRNGVPAGRSCERSLSVVNSDVDLVVLVERLSPVDAVELSKLLVERFGNVVSEDVSCVVDKGVCVESAGFVRAAKRH